MINTRKQREENQDREIPYRAAELGSKPNSAEVDETEEPELGTRARASGGKGELDSASWGETGV
jgi:hypothetical protein